MDGQQKGLYYYFGKELFDRIMEATDMLRAKEMLEAMPERKFCQCFNQASEIIYREQIVRDVARMPGRSSIPANELEPMVELHQLGFALAASALGHQRGLKVDPRLRRRIEREMLLVAEECGAMFQGKLVEMKPRSK